MTTLAAFTRQTSLLSCCVKYGAREHLCCGLGTLSEEFLSSVFALPSSSLFRDCIYCFIKKKKKKDTEHQSISLYNVEKLEKGQTRSLSS